MTDYKATPEQWDALEKCSHAWPGAWGPCILELRARVEALEVKYETQRLATLERGKDVYKVKHWSDEQQQRIEALEGTRRPASKVHEISEPLQLTPEQAQQLMDLLTPDSKPAVKGPLLITRVAAAISQDGESINWSGARAAIREVAAWLKADTDLEYGPTAARWLEQEAER